MLKQTTIDKLAKAAKLTTEQLTTAITTTEEVDLDVSDITAFTAAELAARDLAIDTKAYKKGTIAGVEMGVKEAKEKLGITGEGKDIDTLLELHEKKVLADAKIPVEAHKETIGKLQKTIESKDLEITAAKNETASVRRTTKIMSLLPENKSGLSPTEILGVLGNNGYDFDEVDSKIVVKKDGEILADDLQKPLGVDVAIGAFYKQRGWDAAAPGAGGTGGRGGASSKLDALKPKTMSGFTAEWEKAGKSTQTAEFAAGLEAASKEAGFDMDA